MCLNWPVLVRVPSCLALIVVAVGLVVCDGIGQAEPVGPKEPEAIVVDAVGLAEMSEGKPLPLVRYEALLDARRNAVALAHVLVETESRAEQMRLTESFVRVSSAGYIQQMHVWEEGPVPDSLPPLYRVRVRAVVQPVLEASAPSLAAISAAASTPLIVLLLQSDLPTPQRVELENALSRALRSCGVRVRQSGYRGAALTVSVKLMGGESPGGRVTAVQWEIGPGSEEAAAEGPYAMQPARGQLLIGAGSSASDWSQRVAMAIAQDVFRLWATPRWTRLQFLNLTDAQIVDLKEAAGSGLQWRLEATGESPRLELMVSLSGDPMAAVRGLLSQARLADKLEAVQVTLTCLSFRPKLGAQPPAAAELAGVH